MKLFKTCPACGGIPDHINPIDDTLAFASRVKCFDCGTIFFDRDVQDQNTYDAAYNGLFLRYGDIRKAIYYATEIEHLAGLYFKDPKILEVGPGAGLTQHELARKCFTVTGIEKDEESARTLRRELYLNVLSGGLESLPKELSYDIIFSSHVIEHWTFPGEFLKHCKNHLKKDGIIFINTPCADYAGKNPKEWHHYKTRQAYEHCTLMTENGILACAEREGLSTLYIKRHEKFESMDLIFKKRLIGEKTKSAP